ncbi:MAG: hypothetical protein JO166_12865 [Deltaproteobacteria bacterium]|nr:hypothetical protein [Deltaproteobacteria bacterium]
MRSSAIVASFKRSPALLGIAAFIGLSPVTAMAGSAQLHSVDAGQAVIAERHSDSGAVTSSATLLKTSTSPAAPNANVGLQPVAAAVVQPTAAKGPVPGPASASAAEAPFNNLDLLTPAQRRVYRRAASAFGLFCQHWENLLHEREVNNLGHLSWRNDGGLETAVYTGYGKVESCECRASKEGLPIGKIRYEEINYSIAGKTINEARHAAPKLVNEISTLEIFSWDKGKWFY